MSPLPRPSPVDPTGVRTVPAHFAWVDHRLRDRLEELTLEEIALLLFLHLAADAAGCSSWADATIARKLGLPEDTIVDAPPRAGGQGPYRLPVPALPGAAARGAPAVSLVVDVPTTHPTTTRASQRGPRTDAASPLAPLPLRVAPAGDGTCEVLDGFKRLAHWRQARHTHVPVVVDADAAGVVGKARLLEANAPRRTLSAMGTSPLARRSRPGRPVPAPIR